MKRFTDQNKRTLLSLKGITESSSSKEIAGMLAASHLKGVGGALQMKSGNDNTDAYGTAASTYFQLGAKSQISAALGGITSGPKSGYPATLHGTEVITPLEPNSILEKLAKTSATDSTTATQSSTIEQTMREMSGMHSEMMAMFESKLNEMIHQMETSNSTQSDILKHSRT